MGSPRLDGGGGVLKLSKTKPGGRFSSMHGPASEADMGENRVGLPAASMWPGVSEWRAKCRN